MYCDLPSKVTLESRLGISIWIISHTRALQSLYHTKSAKIQDEIAPIIENSSHALELLECTGVTQEYTEFWY